MKRVYGWKRDRFDYRDFPYRSPRRLIPLPLRVDLRPYCSPVENQGAVGSCTGQAFAGVLEYLDRRDDGAHADVSRLFIYYNERRIEGTTDEDAGAYIRDGIKALKEWGACDEYLWPYRESWFAYKPSEEAYQDALKRRIVAYYRVSSLGDLRAALADGNPVVFGFMVFASFESAEVARTGIMPMPTADDEFRGGHAVLCVGYCDETRRLIVRNSWGASWGDNGYFYMPYSYINDPGLSSDFWVIRGDGIVKEEPENPLPQDTVWYIPIISIIVKLWEWIKERK
jgi:C1A family cysteine protease